MKRTAKFLYQNPFLLFALFVFVVYLPVFLPFFHLKNDLLTQNLPTRFVISESLYSGYFPWWNPYIHYGIPQYGDMNNGFWNPFMWLIAKTVGYSIYSITWEEMFYLLLGGWGMYKLIKEFFYKETALLIGLSYLCCGYAVGHLQHFIWITGLAFFPYVLLFFIRTHKNSVLKNFIGAGICTFFFISSTHPGLIIGAAYFFLFAVIFIYLFRHSVTKTLYSKKFWPINVLMLVIATLSCIVVIVSNLDVVQYISRGNKVSLEETLLNPTTLQSYLSVLFPLAVHKTSFFNTDISMRNVYGGMALIFGLLLYFKNIDRKIVIYSFLPLLFFILLASGGWFKTIAWQIIPFTGYVRMNGEFTYFVMLILFLFAAAGLNPVFKQEPYEFLFVNPARTLLFLYFFAALAALISIFITRSSFIYSVNENTGKAFIKYFFEKLSFTDLLFVQSIISLLTIWVVKKFRFSFYALVFIFCLNLVITTWLCLPYTGLGMKSKKEIQQVISSTPKGILKQDLTPVNQTQFIPLEDKNELMLLSSYSKKIGHPAQEDYPVQLQSSKDYFNDSSVMRFINKQAWIFLSSDTIINAQTNFSDTAIQIIESGPGHIRCSINNTGFRYLVLLQNDYPYWKVMINKNNVTHFTAFKTFITIPVANGKNYISLSFEPILIKRALWLNCFVFIICLLVLGSAKWRNKKIFK
jgi:hypothetical protein